MEGEQPHVRPFGAVCEFEGKLYIATNNKKRSLSNIEQKTPSDESVGVVQGSVPITILEMIMRLFFR